VLFVREIRCSCVCKADLSALPPSFGKCEREEGIKVHVGANLLIHYFRYDLCLIHPIR
jgi:hypothetical protein